MHCRQSTMDMLLSDDVIQLVALAYGALMKQDMNTPIIRGLYLRS